MRKENLKREKPGISGDGMLRPLFDILESAKADRRGFPFETVGGRVP
jgi:hypothetical protein